MFATDQILSDSQGNQVGSYQVWSKQDPERPGNVLLTSIGTTGGASSPTETVRVSIKYNPSIFDYTFFVGDPANPNSEMEFWRDSDHGCGWDDSDWNNHSGEDHDGYHEDGDHHEWHDDCGTTTIVGKTHVNGKLEVEGDEEHGNGHIVLLSRAGHTDTVTYTSSYDVHRGSIFSGNITPTRSAPVDFPVVNFSADLTTANNSGAAITLTFNSSGSPPAGWTRNDSTFSITAQEFVNRYNGRVVRIMNNYSNARFQINGSSSSPQTITSTIQVLAVGSGLSTRTVNGLRIYGPGISMQPANGLAILSAQGDVRLKYGVVVGSQGNGALIYCSGTGGDSKFQIIDGGTVYGTIAVKGQAGQLKTGDDSHVAQDTTLIYDDNYVSKLPTGWWNYGSMTSFKENYARD
ncbi:MAG: hypothetical protein WC828_06380 [Thermoleophilia bacterium]